MSVCKTFIDVLTATAACDIIMVDMPIGLPDGADPRACDIEAQVMLGSRGKSSVFPAPPRSALIAMTPRDFQAMYRQARNIGAPVPLWGIVPKIREVDAAMSASLQQRVREFHPELAWRRLAGSVLPSKKSTEGFAERMRLLQPLVPTVTLLVQQRPRYSKPDDVLDALVGLIVADAIISGHAHRIPDGWTCVDARGLGVEMWF